MRASQRASRAELHRLPKHSMPGPIGFSCRMNGRDNMVVPYPSGFAFDERAAMKTTLNLNDQILRRAKRSAARDGTTLTRCVEDALRAKLMEDDRHKPAFKLKPTTVRGQESPNVEVSDREALYDVMDRS